MYNNWRESYHSEYVTVFVLDEAIEKIERGVEKGILKNLYTYPIFNNLTCEDV